MTAQTVESPVLGQPRALPRFGVTARRDTPGVSGHNVTLRVEIPES